MDSLDPRLFFAILHSFIRVGSSEEEKARTERVMNWFGENLTTLSRVTESPDRRLLGVIWDHWMQHKSAPSRTAITKMVEVLDKPDAIFDSLSQYDSCRAELPTYDDFEMDQALAARKRDWEDNLIQDVLKQGLQICHGSVGGKKQGDAPRKGGKDALNYILEKFAEGILVDDRKAMGGSLRANAQNIHESYVRSKEDNATNKLTIPTSLEPIDNLLGGLKRKTLWGVLGYAGQRKSAVCRTICYFAAMAGFRVLHIPLESEAEEEMNIYGILHARSKTFSNEGISLDIAKFYEGKLTQEEEYFLATKVLPDLKANMPGDIIIRQPIDQKWAAIRTLIEMENRIAPIDLVFMDYLTLVDVSHERNKVECINGVISEFKRMCLTFDDGRGFAGLTPVQGNREGHLRAQENGGAWDKEGIFQFNEFEKSLDVLMYVYQDTDLQAANQLKIGTCKSRRSADLPVTTFGIEPESGRVTSLSGMSSSEIAIIADDRDIIR